jgi:hypothetical protein
MACTGPAFADGMVFPEVFRAKVEIPNQQALIHFSDGLERLVIETSFLGEGTNFAWVVPLPAPPEVKPVSESFFTNLRQAFQPRLIHAVNPYYAGVLLVCGLAFLGARALKDKGSWIIDLPLCLLLAVGAGFIGRHAAFGIVAFVFALGIRLFARSPTAYALILLIGTSFAAILTFAPNAHGPRLMISLGNALGDGETEAIAGVTVVSVQRAGVFDVTTIRGQTPGDVLAWLDRNGYQTPAAAAPAIRRYVDRGWVFVASKVRRDQSGPQLAALHPLAFTFTSGAQVYPTMLTAIDNRDCAIDLFIFGSRRATARHFSATRCDRLALDEQSERDLPKPALRITDPEALALIGNSTVGTKLTGRLTPAQMASDVEIKSGFFWSIGRRVYSRSGALTIALNVALPLAALGWLLMGMSQGGWKIDERWISRWRWRFLAAAAGLGLAVFLLLPKVEVQAVSPYPEQSAVRVPFQALPKRGSDTSDRLMASGTTIAPSKEGWLGSRGTRMLWAWYSERNQYINVESVLGVTKCFSARVRFCVYGRHAREQISTRQELQTFILRLASGYAGVHRPGRAPRYD